MTIKKQFITLASIIITIPILCLAFVCLQDYLNSSDRYLIDGSQKIRKFDSNELSSKDKKTLFGTLRLLPPEVEAVVIDNNDKIIFTSIPDIDLTAKTDRAGIWQYINETSDMYFYQFTSLKITDDDVTLITRISRDKHDPHKPRDILPTIIAFLFIIVTICVFFIIIISRTIFNSIIKIKEKTQELADGNLQTEVISNDRPVKENEITSILSSLEKMRIALLDEQNRKNKFVMGLSHDLRTPVAIIKGYTEALSDGVITEKEELSKTFDLIQNKTNQLESMIDTLINFMKLNDSEIRENLQPASISKIIKNFAKDCEITGNVFKRNIVTRIDLPEDLEVPLNEQLVIRSFENLFSNALRYTHDNDKISIISYIKNDQIFMIISDTGIGIEEKDLKYIFDMFYRGTNSRHEEGMGIGLSVVKNIIETHGWKIDVESKKNIGTTFTITIPLETA